MSAAWSPADKTLWGFVEQVMPKPPQEITREATHAELRSSIDGWVHVRGRMFWHRPTNTLLPRADRRFVSAYRRARKLGAWDA